MKTILVTGGAGYIGSHICVELIEAGFDVLVVDNLSNSCQAAIDRVQHITCQSLQFYHQDLRDEAALQQVFRSHKVDAVIHLAGLKAVGESCEMPLHYYQNNLDATLVLLDVMQQFDVSRLVFSSSATVYGDPATVPIDESFPLTATNPYGRTKLMIEQILQDVVQAASRLQVIVLRYFNPAGAHETGLIGEDPSNIPNNLLPYVSQVAIGKLDKVSVFGNDYPTQDGTGVRDYIHVVDLAKGHVKALQRLDVVADTHFEAINLGTGHGYSVLEVIKAYETACGHHIAYEVVARRAGDVAAYYANPALAQELLDWRAEKTLADMVTDAWRWQTKNPQGYPHD